MAEQPFDKPTNPEIPGPAWHGPPPYPPWYGHVPPPAPWVGHTYPGALVAVIGSAVTVLSFLVLPYATFVVSLTAPQAIRFMAQFEPAWNLVWLVPALAALAGVVALSQRLGRRARPSSRVSGFGWVRMLSGLVVAAYVANVIVLSTDERLSDFDTLFVNVLGIGFWFGLFGMITAYIGATIELRNLQRWQREAQQSGGWA